MIKNIITGVIAILFVSLIAYAGNIASNYNNQIANGIGAKTWNNLKSACDDASTTGETILLNNTVYVTSTFTCSAPIYALKGGIISNPSYTLTLTDFNGDTSQHFSGNGAILGLKKINPNWLGAVGDGVTDDSFFIQKAFNVASVNHADCDLLSSYKTTTTITVDYGNFSVYGHGNSLYSSVLGTAYIFSTASSATTTNNLNGYFYSDKYIWSDLYIKGTNTTGYNGLEFGGTNKHASNLSFRNIVISDYDNILTFQSNAYLLHFDKCSFLNAGSNIINYLSGLSNTGENISFNQCVLSNSTNLITVTNGGAGGNTAFNFINTSFDYFTNYAFSITGPGTIRLVSCHIESRYDADYWIKVSGSGSYINLTNTDLIYTTVTPTVAKTKEFLYVGSQGVIQNTNFTTNINSGIYTLTTATGPGIYNTTASFNNNGWFGIGTTLPNSALEINGTTPIVTITESGGTSSGLRTNITTTGATSFRFQNKGNTLFSIPTATVSRTSNAVCWKDNVTLGHCTTVNTSTGACTCN